MIFQILLFSDSQEQATIISKINEINSKEELLEKFSQEEFWQKIIFKTSQDIKEFEKEQKKQQH